MSTRSGQRAPVVEPGTNPAEVPGTHHAPPESFPTPAEPEYYPGTTSDDDRQPDQELLPASGIDMNDPEALMAEAMRLKGVHLSDDPRADLSRPETVVFPGNPRDVMRQAEAIARDNDPWREHAQVAMGDSIIHVQDAIKPLIASASTPDIKRSLNDLAEVSTVARQLHNQVKFTIILPNGAENKQYDHPFGINGYIIYVLTGVPSIVPESIYLMAVTAGLISPQRKKDYSLCPRISDLVRAAQIQQQHMGAIRGAGIIRD